MSENSEQTIVEDGQAVEPISHKRILFVMATVAVLGAIAGWIFISANFGLGILIGGILSLVNYYWLKRTLRGIFETIIRDGQKPPFMGAHYFLRYLTFAAILTIVYLTEAVPVIALLLGLASFALALTIEGFIRLFSSFFK